MTAVFANPANFNTIAVAIDPDGSGTPYTFEIFPYSLPPAAAVPRDNARVSFIATTNTLTTISIVADAPTTILDPYSLLPVASKDFDMAGQPLELVYNLARDQWLFTHTPVQRIIEFWSAAPIVDLNNSTLIWTFVPLPGGPATSVLWTHAAGVLTSLAPFSVITSINLSTETEVILINNTDAQFTYTPQYAGTGTSLLSRIVGVQQSSRAASFFQSKETNGLAQFVAGDTLSILGNSIGTAQSDLDRAALTFQVVV